MSFRINSILGLVIMLLSSSAVYPQIGAKVNQIEDPAKINSVETPAIDRLDGITIEAYCKNCKEILEQYPASPDGIYTIDPDGSGDMEPFECYCDMTTDGGGWTLAAVHSDDGQDNWTYNNRQLFYNETFIGDINALDLDYKGRAMVQLDFSDVLFIHSPSGIWASYHHVGDGTSSFANYLQSFPFPHCSTDPSGTMSAGTLSTDGTSLCNTYLYFNAGDWEGTSMSNCTNLYRPFPYNEAAWGPAWSVNNNSGCPFDDPGSHGSLGPNFQTNDSEASAIGFGWAIGGNTGTSGSGENHMHFFIR